MKEDIQALRKCDHQFSLTLSEIGVKWGQRRKNWVSKKKISKASIISKSFPRSNWIWNWALEILKLKKKNRYWTSKAKKLSWNLQVDGIGK